MRGENHAVPTALKSQPLAVADVNIQCAPLQPANAEELFYQQINNLAYICSM